MVYRYDQILKNKNTTKFTLIGVALVFAVTLLLNIFVSTNASSQPVSYTDVPLTQTELDNNWVTDRTSPSGGFTSLATFMGRSDVLQMNVDVSNPSPISSWYYYEGIKRDLPDNMDAVRADMYIDSSWLSNDVQVGIWGVGRDAGDVISAYPILEFTTVGEGDFTGWRIFNDAAGGWINLLDEYSTDEWNEIQLVLNSDTSLFDMYINGDMVASSFASGSTELDAVILNNRTYPDTGSDYSAHWSNFGHGVVVLEAPMLVAPSNNAVVTGDYLLSDWSDVDGAAEYMYQSYHDALANNIRYTNTYTDSEKSASNVADTVFWWRVKAIDAAGQEGEWSELWKVTVDNTVPTTPTVLGFLNPMLPCGEITKIHSTTVDWSDSTDENGIYRYEYFIDYPKDDGTRGEWTTYVYGSSQRSGSLNEGAHFIKVRAQDNAGNYSGWSNICSITADWTAPVVAIDNPFDTNVLSENVDVTGTVVDTNLSHYNISLYPGDADFNDFSKRIYSDTVYGPEFTSKTLWNFDTTTFPDGEYLIRLAARDLATNRDLSEPYSGGTTSVHVIHVSLDNYVDNKDECKKGGWERGVFGQEFRNQGDCVSHFVSEKQFEDNPDEKATMSLGVFIKNLRKIKN